MNRGHVMTYFCVGVLAIVALGTLSVTDANAAADDNPVVVMDTTAGKITIELNPTAAPATVKNFLKLVDDGYYDGLIFHRVIPDFMIQGGGLTEKMEDKSDGQNKVVNESNNGLSNKRGTIAMARKNDPDSASAQFYINVKDNNNLDGRQAPTGYTVFGKVTDGLDTVDSIVKAKTTTKVGRDGMQYANCPETPIVIKSAKRKPAS